MQNRPLPSGTVTFLFTDIEGSTKRWEAYRQAMQLAFSRQEAILRHAIGANGGYTYKMIGDAFQSAFPTAPQALQAAIDAQRSLHSESWPEETGEVRVRMALHTGTTEERGDDYVGPALNRVARLLSAGHGGQVLLSTVTQELVRDTLPPGVQLVDLGEHRLKDLIRPEHIFQLVVGGLPSEFPPLKTLDNRPNNLPLQPTPLIGREKELAELQRLLEREETRLLTLTGPGGTGKTRLALQVASEVLDEDEDDYKDGVWFVDLSPLMDSGLVVPTVASVLGVKEAGGGQPIFDTLKQYLKGKSMLLVLDNFEQVVEAAKEVSTLIAACPNVKVLATSRIPLHIRGEKEYPVPPLSTPDLRNLPTPERLSQYEAVRLFIERATDVKPDFQVTNENAPAVAEICARVDGLPLAIELAAARIRLFPPNALLARLSSRLKLLTGGAKDLPARQQTLRDTIEWSYDLLSEGEKQLLRRMAVFHGGRTLEALEAVCNYDGNLQVDVLEGVEGLVSQSLLQQREGRDGRGRGEGEGDGEPRFWMLETIHEYAGEKLADSGEGEALQREHAIYFMKLAEEAQQHMLEAQQEWLERLEEEYDNIRAALQWAEEHQQEGEGEATEIGLRIAGALGAFWEVRSYNREGRGHLERLLAGLRSREIVDKRYIAVALFVLGALAVEQGDYTYAGPVLEESLALERELRNKSRTVLVLVHLGWVASGKGDYTHAVSVLEDSLNLAREIGDKQRIELALSTLGAIVSTRGDYTRAAALLQESLALEREIGNKRAMVYSLINLGGIVSAQGDYTRGHFMLEESLALAREIGEKRGFVMAMIEYGNMLVAGSQSQGKTRRGAAALGWAEAELERLGVVLGLDERKFYEQAVGSARAQLGEEEFQRALQEGRAMSMEQAIQYALEVS